jgi:ABC-2 type transport system permease protein
MRKTIIVAIREYSAAVKTKSFLISLVVLPLMMMAGVLVQWLGQKLADTSTKHVAIIDRTPGAALYPSIVQAVERHNALAVNDATGRQVRSKFMLELIDPKELADDAAVRQQRLELSDRVRSGELIAFVEIGQDLLKPSTRPADVPVAEATAATLGSLEDQHDDADDASIRYSTNRPTYRDFVGLLESTIPRAVREKRLTDAGMSYDRLASMLEVPRVTNRGLAVREVGGDVACESKTGQIAPFIVPVAMLMLMFMVVIVGASPMTANIIEEKTLRIAEVLLGSVSPFELMMGKLLGGVGVALTLAAIYFGAAYYVALKQGMAGYVTGGSMVWFVVFTILGTLMYGALFVAAGAAVTNIKEAQTMVMPVMLLIIVPLSLTMNIIQDPGGVIALSASFFPLSAPMVMTARIVIPPGTPIWQVILSALVSLTTTVVLIWAAGRIFRVGILLQGQGANYAQLARWIIRG